MNFKIYPNYGDIYSFKRKLGKISGKGQRPKGLKVSAPKVSLRFMKGFKWELIQPFLSFFNLTQRLKYFLKKRGQQKKAMLILK